MDRKTLMALLGSIAKWECVINNDNYEEKGAKDCLLCEIFQSIDRAYSGLCKGCPVMEYSGRPFCHETPYQSWTKHQFYEHEDEYKSSGVKKVRCDKCRDIAHEELEFLKSLLPKKVKINESENKNRA